MLMMMKALPILIMLLLWPGSYPAQKALSERDVSSRAPFVLELPEVSPERIVNPIVRIAEREISVFKIRVVKPFDAEIRNTNLVITLNGSGVKRSCVQTRDTEGSVYTCTHNGLWEFAFERGKNVLEVQARGAEEKEYYASFMVSVGDTSPTVVAQNNEADAEVFSGRKFALVVGVSDYRFQDVGLTSLDYPDDDARSFAEFLRSPEGGNFGAANVTELLNGDASSISVRAALDGIAKRAGPNDLVVIYISGHGAPDPFNPKNLYFLFHDTKVVAMDKTAYPMAELQLYLETRLAAKRVIVFIDTCHSAGVNQRSGKFVATRQLTREDENNISNMYLSKRLFNEKGRAIITSSDVNELSQESAKWGHGLFTWALLDGLKGKADSNNDGYVTAGEIFRHTRSVVQRESNFQQNPIALPGSTTGIALAAVRGGAGKSKPGVQAAPK
jgi:uncharacterized caspase-like protein